MQAPLTYLRKWAAATGQSITQLTAIEVDPTTKAKGLIESRSFIDTDLDDGGAVERWITERQGRSNIYYAINALREPKNSKATKTDIEQVVALHVDIDCPEGEPVESFVERYAAGLRALRGGILEPSVIVASGGGVQAFWILQPDDRIRIDGDLAKAEAAERYTRGLEAEVASHLGVEVDHCFNIDRIMRCPFTRNLADAKKLAKGRHDADARLIQFNDLRYPLGAFAPAAPKDAASSVEPTAKVDWSRVAEHEGWLKSSADLPGDTPRKWKLIVDHTGTFKELNEDLKAEGLVAKGYAGGSELSMALAGHLKSCGYPLEKIAAGLMCPLACNAHITKKHGNDQRYAVGRAIVRSHDKQPAAKAAPPGAVVLGQYDPVGRARKFVEARHPNVRHYRDDFVDYEGGRYATVADSSLRADVYDFLDGSFKNIGSAAEPNVVPFEPGPESVSATVDALKAVQHVRPTIEQPCWLDNRDAPDPCDVVSFPNGIYDLRRETLLPPSPELFTPYAVGFPYDPTAPDPKNWKDFLRQIFDGEQEQIDALQEWNGYCMWSDVSFEKAGMLLGEKRSGKDTTRHVLQSLLPAGAVCGPTLDSLATNFGMSQLINKQLAVVGDMRLGSKADRDLLAENVLKLTGRGLFTIDRKHKEHWTGNLPCKLLLISNEMPRIKDTSGALASRFIIFNTRQSFYGREERNLFRDKLAPELPGIALWAMEGLRRVRERGALAEPHNSIEQRQQLARDGSPVLAFVEERLVLDPQAKTPKDQVHEAYSKWAAANGLYLMSKNAFVRDLVAATGGKVRPFKMSDEDRTPGLLGVRMKVQGPAAYATRPSARGGDRDIPF
jgi:P4 family phage/plasmid primase-like protien